MTPRLLVPLLLMLLVGCSSATKSVRLHTGPGEPIVFTPRTGDAGPVELDEDDFVEALEGLAQVARPSTRPQDAARRLFEVEARSGSYLYETRSHRTSIRYDITQSFTQTVWQWLSTQSYEAQREFGLLAIENVKKGFW